jgi:antitoxin component YwqK of YwqJK toxin-antitoxin module
MCLGAATGLLGYQLHKYRKFDYRKTSEIPNLYFNKRKIDNLVINGDIGTSCEYIDGKIHGKYLQYEKHGSKWVLRISSNYNNGKLDGEHIRYFLNGSVNIKCSYSDDDLHGEYVKYSYSGQIEQNSTYNHGKLHGTHFVSNSNFSHNTINSNYINGILDGEFIMETNSETNKYTYIMGKKNGPSETIYHNNDSDYNNYDDYPPNYDDNDHKTTCNYLNDVLHGDYTIYNFKNELKLQCNYTNGLIDGKQVSKTDRGMKTQTYSLGNVVGLSEVKNTDGILLSSCTYELIDGKSYKVGKEMEYFDNGKIRIAINHGKPTIHHSYYLVTNGTCTEYYESGQVKHESRYDDGHLHGNYVNYNSDGSKSTEMVYEKGELHGNHITYNSDGSKCGEKVYKKGVLHGNKTEYITLPDKSILKNVIKYTNGKIDGKYKEYDNFGKLLVDGESNNGKRIGLYTKYNGDSIECKLNYSNNVIDVLEANDKTGRNLIFEEGDQIGYKACRSDGLNVFVKLLIPKEAKRTKYLMNSDKLRAEYAKVLEIYDENGNKYDAAVSHVSSNRLVYKLGELVYPDKYNDNMEEPCGSGINFHKYEDMCKQWFRNGY